MRGWNTDMDRTWHITRRELLGKRLHHWLTGGRSAAQTVLYLLIFLLFAVFAFSYLYVLIWCFLSGLKTHSEVIMTPFSWPKKGDFGHYIEVFDVLEVNDVGFLGMLFNSVYFSIVGPIVSILTTAMLAYVASKYRFPGSRMLYFLSIAVMTLPIYGSGGAAYRLRYNLGLIDTYLVVILSIGGPGTTFLYFYAFFQNLSSTFIEAARIDGAGHYTIFFRIILPLSMPILSALFITSWIGAWSSYADAIVYYPQLPTLGVAIFTIQRDMVYYVRSDLLYAACFIMCVPTLIIFSAFNNTIMKNVSFGGIKE